MNIVGKIAAKVAKNKAKILDDFCEAFLASRWDDYFSKQKKIDFKRVELVEDRSEFPDKIVYSIRLKKGKLPK